jgi:hypothetical protein
MNNAILIIAAVIAAGFMINKSFRIHFLKFLGFLLITVVLWAVMQTARVSTEGWNSKSSDPFAASSTPTPAPTPPQARVIYPVYKPQPRVKTWEELNRELNQASANRKAHQHNWR